MSTYKLNYFNLTALGEPIRMLFNYGGINFEDNRFERADWPNIKPNMPFGQAPTLQINDKTINQSNAIARYVAKMVKLAGKDDLHALEIDAVVDNINDLRLKIAQYWYESDPAAKESKKADLYNVTVPFFLERIDALARDNGGFLVRNELSWADIYFVGLLDYLNFMLEFDIVEKYPNLLAVKNNVNQVPTIKKYLETRPKTEF